MRFRFAFTLVVTLLAVPLHAEDINQTVSRNAGQDVVTSPEVTNGGTKTLPATLQSVRLGCNTGVPCAGVTVALGGSALCTVAQGANGCDATLPASQATQLFVVRRGTTPIFSAMIERGDTAPNTTNTDANDTDSDTDTVELADMLKTPCEDAIASQLTALDLDSATNPAETKTYSRSQNDATFLVDILGNVLAAPTENVDENDTVTVRVMADTRLHGFLRVRRKSVIRTPANRIVGSGLKVPVVPGTGAQDAGDEGVCGPKDFILKDFNPGKGEVEIQAHVGTQTQPLGTFEFVVNPLYNGMFSFGTATSDLTDRAFKLQTQGEKKIIYSTEEGDTTRYVVYFTPFMRARDIEKSGEPFWQHINPTFGISTQGTENNAYAGVSIDYKGFVVSGGLHFSRINDLASASGLKEGSEFAGAEADIPQAKRWENERFIGISIDLRSAVELFQTLVSGAGGGGS